MKVSRGGRPGLPSLKKPMVSVDVKQHSTSSGAVSTAGEVCLWALISCPVLPQSLIL